MQKPKQVYTTLIRTTQKKLWDAITKPEFTRQYWAGVENVSTWKKDAKWEHIGGPANKREPWITGKVVKSVPPKLLVLTWADPDDLADKSRVTFQLEPLGDTVCLTVTHDNFKPGSKMAGKVAWGWPRVLSSMKSYLETGTGLDISK
jgi:uncharacterized protein YndB with AHSA1/START domain